MIPSKKHSNRKAYNFIVYNNIDACLIKHSSIIRGQVIDLGCGEMPYREWILQHSLSYQGVDWSATMHELRADVLADLNNVLPIKDEVADTVISLSVIEHLSNPQLMLNESYRILKKNGSLLMQVPWQWQIHEAPHDYYRYTSFGLLKMLKKAGYVNIKIEPQSGFFTMMVLKMNYFSRRFIRGPRPIRWLCRIILLPFWYFGQLIAPYLDKKFDNNWAAETVGFFVTASKP